MILIISDDDDYSTFKVLLWLEKFKAPFQLLCPKSDFEVIEIVISDSEEDILFKINDKMIRYSEITCVWYRRGGIQFDFIKSENIKSKFHNRELRRIKEFVIYKLNLKPKITPIEEGSVNKLQLLSIAKKVGLKIPKTIISSSKNIKDKLDNKKIFMKPVAENRIFNDYAASFSYTYRMLEKENLRLNFALTQFQEYSEKELEIRIFHLNGKNYSMAMFTQSNDATKLDFRVWGLEKPNRCVPHILPNEIEVKINKLMNLCGHNSGSLDLIYNKGEYVFIELNPIGQYDMVSVPCNYNLDKVIAKELIHLHEKRS